MAKRYDACKHLQELGVSEVIPDSLKVDISMSGTKKRVINLVVDSPSHSFLAKDLIPVRDAS